MVFVCDWCGKVGPVNICNVGNGIPGHSNVHNNCSKEKGWKHTDCEMPGCTGWVQRRLTIRVVQSTIQIIGENNENAMG